MSNSRLIYYLCYTLLQKYWESDFEGGTCAFLQLKYMNTASAKNTTTNAITAVCYYANMFQIQNTWYVNDLAKFMAINWC